jgi:hypothetical protein
LVRFQLRPPILAQVAQLMERWSYKPEVEGLSPSLGTRLSGRDSSWQNGDCTGVWSSEARRPHAPATHAALARVPGIGLLNRTFESWADRHEVQLLRGLPNLQWLCSSTGKSKRLISARLVVQLHPQPPNLRAGDVTDSIGVLQTSCEGLTPSQSTKLRRSSIGFRALVL